MAFLNSAQACLLLNGFLKIGVPPSEAPFSGGVQDAAFSRVGVGCMAMFAAFPSTNMEAAFGRLHNSGAGAFGAGSTVVEVAEGRLDIGGWEGGKHSHTSHPHTY